MPLYIVKYFLYNIQYDNEGVCEDFSMNNDFPRILSLLRKERNLSQKQVASDLEVAQALLSHYEKGKRECGLDFLVRAADYYGVSTDYLLGRSPVSSGTTISESDIPETEIAEKANSDVGGLSANLSKKLISSSLDVIYSSLAKTKSQKLTLFVTNTLTMSVYKAFRLVFHANPKNDRNIFGVSEDAAYRSTDAIIALSEGKAFETLNSEDFDDTPVISTISLENDYQKQATALLSLIKNCETQIKKLDK